MVRIFPKATIQEKKATLDGIFAFQVLFHGKDKSLGEIRSYYYTAMRQVWLTNNISLKNFLMALCWLYPTLRTDFKVCSLLLNSDSSLSIDS